MTRNEIKPGYAIQLGNGSTYVIYRVENTNYVCLPQAHHMCLTLSDVCKEDLSPVKYISPIVKVWDNFGSLVYEREKTVTISMEQIAKMLNVPVSQLRIKE
jgi:dihydroorotase